jgi:hypothetical protein
MASENAHNGDLTEFGSGVSFDPPKIQKRERVHAPTPDATRQVGFLAATTNRDGAAFVTTRDSQQHRIRHLCGDGGGSYAISKSALRTLARTNVRWVFVHEQDTNTVLEWPAKAFHDGPEVPDAFLQTSADAQRYVTRDSAARVWDEYGPDELFIPRGATLDDPGLPVGRGDE